MEQRSVRKASSRAATASPCEEQYFPDERRVDVGVNPEVWCVKSVASSAEGASHKFRWLMTIMTFPLRFERHIAFLRARFFPRACSACTSRSAVWPLSGRRGCLAASQKIWDHGRSAYHRRCVHFGMVSHLRYAFVYGADGARVLVFLDGGGAGLMHGGRQCPAMKRCGGWGGGGLGVLGGGACFFVFGFGLGVVPAGPEPASRTET